MRSSSRRLGDRLLGEYRNFSSCGIPFAWMIVCVGLSGKNTFSLLSVFNNRRNFVCSWSPPVLLGGPEIVRRCGTGTRRGLFGGSAGGSVCWGLRIPSAIRQRRNKFLRHIINFVNCSWEMSNFKRETEIILYFFLTRICIIKWPLINVFQ